MKNVIRLSALFAFGGALYFVMELVWRQRSHWSMILVGGFCFVLIGLINELYVFDLPLLRAQAPIATGIILVVELIAGVIFNIWLGLNVWDYSHLPFNILGQICLYYAGLWFGVSLIGIILDDFLRYWFFGEEKPHYRL